jgi:oligopeptide/dipeptide ABC transporter ATP-binding protein
MNELPLLDVRDLVTELQTERGAVRAVDGVGFSLGAGETVGLVGESGSGKTLTALSIMRLVPCPPGRVAAGQILLDGRDILKLDEAAMRRLRGDAMAMVFQEPLTALNPVLTIGAQVAEALRQHRGAARREARDRAVQILADVGIPEAGRRYGTYPHQLSGGMRQRVLVAMALACEPRVLLADEPTTALDVTLQAQVLELLARTQQRTGMGVLLISHDLSLIASRCDRVVVMYAGQVVEIGSMEACLERPAHPYTASLLEAARALMDPHHPLQARPAAAFERPASTECGLLARCERSDSACRRARPPLREMGPGHYVRCLRPLSERGAGAR